MAELALPLIGLGALYVLSNKKPENNRSNETFTNMGRNINNLPNTAVPNNNYPIPRQPIDRTSDNYTRQYLNENQTTDKFFNSNIGLANKTDAQINKEFKSLSGNDLTEKNSGVTVTLALNYGGRYDIIYGINKLLENKDNLQSIKQDDFKDFTLNAGIPDPDLLIRTGGEKRLSNFLLWDLAYTELIFLPNLWPDFNKSLLDQCLLEYSKRTRKYGGDN